MTYARSSSWAAGLVVERSTTARTEHHAVDIRSDGAARERTCCNGVDADQQVAKVRVAGSNPVVRSSVICQDMRNVVSLRFRVSGWVCVRVVGRSAGRAWSDRW